MIQYRIGLLLLICSYKICSDYMGTLWFLKIEYIIVFQITMSHGGFIESMDPLVKALEPWDKGTGGGWTRGPKTLSKYGFYDSSIDGRIYEELGIVLME